jgi:ABC-type histidine transport system ATPase subunit
MILHLENVTCGYGLAPVLHGISLDVNEGEMVSIIGSNGAGNQPCCARCQVFCGARLAALNLQSAYIELSCLQKLDLALFSA